ncbi:MAG: hypothetical protein ACE361_12885 [Aureliella sp.]
MRIDSSSNPIKPNIAPVENPGSRAGAAASGGLPAPSVDVRQIEGLLQLIVNANQINDSLVNETRARIQTEEFLSKSSAYETASAILNL